LYAHAAAGPEYEKPACLYVVASASVPRLPDLAQVLTVQ